jgi:hypothetical protein
MKGLRPRPAAGWKNYELVQILLPARCELTHTDVMLSAINMVTLHPADLAKTEITAVYAGFWLRLIATLVDMLALYIPLGFAFLLVTVVTKFVNARR